MGIIKTGNGIYGKCYIEEIGTTFWVVVCGSKHGPYSNYQDALAEFKHWCNE